MVASDAPLDRSRDAARAIAASPSDFAAAGITRVEDVIATLFLDADGARAFAAGASQHRRPQPVRDQRPAFLALGAGRWVEKALAEYDPLQHLAARSISRSSRAASTASATRTADAAREEARRLAARDVLRGWLAIAAQHHERARAAFADALARDPAQSDAAVGLALADREADSRHCRRARGP
jgi:hypothetical protein